MAQSSDMQRNAEPLASLSRLWSGIEFNSLQKKPDGKVWGKKKECIFKKTSNGGGV